MFLYDTKTNRINTMSFLEHFIDMLSDVDCYSGLHNLFLFKQQRKILFFIGDQS